MDFVPDLHIESMESILSNHRNQFVVILLLVLSDCRPSSNFVEFFFQTLIVNWVI